MLLNNRPFCQMPIKPDVSDSCVIAETESVTKIKDANVKQGIKIVDKASLTLIRGLPGSGKSALAKSLSAIILNMICILWMRRVITSLIHCY